MHRQEQPLTAKENGTKYGKSPDQISNCSGTRHQERPHQAGGGGDLEFIAQLAYKHAKDTFTLPGLGKLVLVNRKARIGRNPATGATIQIAAKRVVKFRVAKAAKDAILGTK